MSNSLNLEQRSRHSKILTKHTHITAYALLQRSKIKIAEKDCGKRNSLAINQRSVLILCNTDSGNYSLFHLLLINAEFSLQKQLNIVAFVKLLYWCYIIYNKPLKLDGLILF